MAITKDQARADVERAVRATVAQCRGNLLAMKFAERDLLDILVGGTLAAIRDHEERIDEIDEEAADAWDGWDSSIENDDE